MSFSGDSPKYEVCFVRISTETENLNLAFEAMDSNQLEPAWVTEEKCLEITKKEPKLFVMDPFEGAVFEHLKSVNCRIVGPLCILYCLHCKDVLPKRPHPVYSVSMRKVTVSCSNLDNSCREDMSKKIELMGGFFSKDLTKSVTHLVVGEVGSKKYQVAANFGLPIMTPDWVEDVWRNGQYQQLHAIDPSYNKYKCPVFKGLVITVSQLSAEERSAIQSIVEENGATYLAALKAKETTHLVLSEPVGDKYRYAKNWKIFCINVNWIHESVKAGYCKDENLYKINDSSKRVQPKRSTPNRDLTLCDLPLVDCSAINNVSVLTHLDETIRSDITLPVNNRKNSWISSLEAFSLSSLPKDDQFLDGCKIFLTGFNSAHLDKLRKIVNSGGGMRFSKYSESVSHVVCGDFTPDFIQSLKTSSVKPYVVNVNWLLECCRCEKLVDETPFLCLDPNPLSPEKIATEIKAISSSQTTKPESKNEDSTRDNITDILKQYICEQNGNYDANEGLPIKSIKEGEKFSAQLNSRSREQDVNNHQDVDIADLAEDEPPSSAEQLFAGLKFVIVGFGEKDSDILGGMVEAHSGQICRNDASFNVDIAVVPIIQQDYTTHAANIITNCWLQKCIEDNRVYEFDENELFKPIEIQPALKPFESFVISVSQYSGTERDCLMHLAEVLGATCQEYFVRKANKSRGILANTHLVVATPDGSKYEASKKWKIPAITKQWVLDTAKLGSVPPIDKYLVDCVPPQLDKQDSSKTSIPRDIINKENLNKNASQIVACVPTRNSLPTTFAEGELENKLPPEQVNSITPNRNLNHLEENPNSETNNFKDPISAVTPHRNVSKLIRDARNEAKGIMSPLTPGTEISMNESLNLDQSYKYKFRVSGVLRDLDISASLDQSLSTSARRHSLPVEELFSKNLASAVRGIPNNMLSFDDKLDEEKNSFIEPCPQPSEGAKILNGVILSVSKKLANLQNELNELVISLGGDYRWSFDNTCTHFVFTGKANDLSKDFREAKAQGKKIICPEWLYACKERNMLMDEQLYPHSLKSNMSLNSEIAIVKNPVNRVSKTADVEAELKDLPKNADVSSVNGNAVDFNQQLNDLLVAAKTAKKRQSKRLLNSISGSPSNEISPNHKLQQRMSDIFLKPNVEEHGTADEPDTCSQQSQSCPVVWDDPTGRMEREKIAALAAANKAELDEPKEVLTSANYQGNYEKENVKRNSNKKKNSMPVQADTSVVTLLQTATDIPHLQVKKKFMFTQIPEPRKIKFIEILTNLGGEVSDEKSFDITSTHLILEKPIKNEKLLCSVASGKWILHPQYIAACQEQNRLVNEEDFEWGGPSSGELLQNLSLSAKKIAKCPFRWRVQLSEHPDLKGAFNDWIAVVIADDKTKQSTYSKILEAGGATVVPYESSNSTVETISHVIVDMKKRSLSQIDLSPYISNNIKCVKPEYLAFFLIEDSPPDAENYLIPEAKELLCNSSEQSSKRRNLSVATRCSKRTRIN